MEKEIVATGDVMSLQEIEECGRRGLSFSQIAGLMGISATTFSAQRKRHPEVEAAYFRGRSRGISKVADTLYDAATSGEDMASTRFYLEKVGGWKENAAATTGNVTITQNNVYIDKVEMIMQMQKLIADNVPIEEWPEAVRAIAGVEENSDV
jgi:hypothetical protein